jgi:protocatechuate 3,4-dioxygenase beta subunit
MRGLLALVVVVLVAVVLYTTCFRSMGHVDQAARIEPESVTEKAMSARAPRVRARPETDAVAGPASPDPELRAPDVPRPAPGTTTTKIELFGKPATLAAPKHTLRGRVVDAAGDPVPDVSVSLHSTWLPRDLCEEALLGWVTSNSTTGPDGAFAVEYWEGGSRELYVAPQEPNGRAWHGVDLGDDRLHEIVVPDDSGALVVRVTTASGKAPEGTVAGVLESPTVTGSVAFSDEIIDGRWRIGRTSHFIPAGPFALFVEARGFAPSPAVRVGVPARGQATVDVTLTAATAGVAVRGTVVDAETGSPVPGAIILLSGAVRGGRPLGVDVAPTDDDGRFAFECRELPPGEVQTWTANSREFASTKFLVGVREGQTECDVTIRLPRPAGVVVRCVDAATRPLEDVLVFALSDYEATEPEGVVAHTTTLTQPANSLTDDEGRARLSPLLHPGGEGTELRTRFYVDGVVVLERSFPPLRAGETRDLGDVVLPTKPK